MPEITEEEFREYVRLKINHEERKQFLEKFSGEKGLKKIEEKRKSMGTTAAMAAAYAKRLMKFYDAYGRRDVFSLRWKDEKEYLTSKNLSRIKGSKYKIKNYFKKLLAEYGWRLRINYDLGLLDVKKVDPK